MKCVYLRVLFSNLGQRYNHLLKKIIFQFPGSKRNFQFQFFKPARGPLSANRKWKFEHLYFHDNWAAEEAPEQLLQLLHLVSVNYCFQGQE